MVVTTRKPAVSSSSSSASSSTSIQRSKNIPIRIETANRASQSPSASRRPSSTIRVQMSEFSVDFPEKRRSSGSSIPRASNSSVSSRLGAIGRTKREEETLDVPKEIDTVSTTATTNGIPDAKAAELEDEIEEGDANVSATFTLPTTTGATHSPPPTKIAYQSPTVELHVPADDSCCEISIDVNEKKSEVGSLSTRILVDAKSNAIAARDVEIEIRRKIKTEFSPPAEPKPTNEQKAAVTFDAPFVFKESHAAPNAQFRDVAIRIDSTETQKDGKVKPIDEPNNDQSIQPERTEDKTDEPQEVKIEQNEESVDKNKTIDISTKEPVENKESPSDVHGGSSENHQNGSPADKKNLTDASHVAIVKSNNTEESIDVDQKNVNNEKPTNEPTTQLDEANENPLEVEKINTSGKEDEIKKDASIQPVEITEKSSDETDVKIERQEETLSKSTKPNLEVRKEEVRTTLTELKEVQQEKTEQIDVQQPSSDHLVEDSVKSTESEKPKNETEIQSPVAPIAEPEFEDEKSKEEKTPFEEVEIDVCERRPSTQDLAEVRVFRERYSAAPVLPYPGDLPRALQIQNARDELTKEPSIETPRLDLSELRKQNEEKPKRPLISPVSSKEKQKVVEFKERDKTVVIGPPIRPQILEDEREISDADETIERLKREPIRLNIPRPLTQKAPQSPPQLSSYDDVEKKKENGGYPSPIELNGLFRPKPIEVRQQTPPFQSTELNVQTTVITQTNLTTTIDSNQRPSSRLSTGTGVRPESDFSPRTLSRINNLNVIMEKNGEKDAGEVIHHHPVFMRDTSKFWYKPTISREEAIAMLKDKEPGTFVVRDSNSFPGAFGLALKVAQPPQGVTVADGTELVRHFLIEPSPKGVKLKGCSNEPVFGTLAALVYQHSITPMALPAKLILPDFDPAETPEHLNANQALLERGAACNVTYICSLDTESLTGPEAVRRAVLFGLSQLSQRSLRAIPVHFKVSAQGITLTDNTRSLFFRRHYPVTTVTFAGIDPESRLFDNNNAFQLPSTYVRQAPMFGFVARKSPSSLENSCHVFAELDPEQPASAVVRFITNVMMVQARSQQQQIHRATAGV